MEESRTAAVGRKRKQQIDYLDRQKRSRVASPDSDVYSTASDDVSDAASVGNGFRVVARDEQTQHAHHAINNLSEADDGDVEQSRQPWPPYVKTPLPTSSGRQTPNIQSMTLEDVTPAALQARVKQLMQMRGGSVYDVVSGIFSDGMEFKAMSRQCLQSFHMKIDKARGIPSKFSSISRSKISERRGEPDVNASQSRTLSYGLTSGDPSLTMDHQITHLASPRSESVSVGDSPTRDESWICAHCGRANQHASWACPSWRKCARCRARGHHTRECRNASMTPGRNGDVCDVCSKPGHVEEECPGLYRTIYPNPDIKKKQRKDVDISCHVCGREGHFAGDCPTIPLSNRASADRWMPWSRAHMRHFISGLDDEVDHDEAQRKRRVRNYQADLLDDLLA